jgi:CheY-like chemotaxis protein
LERIERSTKRGADLIQKILAFSKQEKFQYRPVRLSGVANEAAKVLDSTFPKQVYVHQPNGREDLVYGSFPQLYQLIFNLALNAAQSTEKKGRVDISIMEIHLPKDHLMAEKKSKIALPSSLIGNFIYLVVQDDGVGIPIEYHPFIFDPFFTKKTMGHGSGMGLSIVHSIAQKHRGHIYFSSEEGVGSNFGVLLPKFCKDDHPSARIKIPVQYRRKIQKKKRILLVEDEVEILDALATILQERGYDVYKADSGEKAIENFPNDADIALIDYAMSPINGLEVGQWIHASFPEMPMILMTGYSKDVSPSDIRESGFQGYLPKPFSVDQAIAHIERLVKV